MAEVMIVALVVAVVVVSEAITSAKAPFIFRANINDFAFNVCGER